jgi:AcrR family transcriptional regulator
VLAAAQRQFAEVGYDRTSMRSIAAEAEVDQKLVTYFFSSKQALFVAVTELPFEPGEAIRHVLEGDVAGRGERLARLILEVLENPQAGPRLIGLVRAAAAEPEAARMVRELLAQRIWARAADQLPVRSSSTAVALIATEILGLVMSRYVIRTEPLASLSAESVIGLVAPNLQRLLGGTRGGSRER